MKFLRTRAGDDSVRLRSNRFSDILKPFTTREKVLLGGVFAFVVFTVFGPMATATNADIGSVFLVPSSDCQADDTWTNPEYATGLPAQFIITEDDSVSTTLKAETSSTESALVCSGFTKNNVHIMQKPTINLWFGASRQAQESIEDIQAPAAELSLANLKLDSRSEIIEPNAFSSVTEIDLDALVTISISADGGKSWDVLHTFDNSLFTDSSGQKAIAIPKQYLKKLHKLAVAVQLVSQSEDQYISVDSIGMSYEVGAGQQLSADVLTNTGEINDDDLLILNRDSIELEITSKDPTDGIWQGIADKVAGQFSEEEIPTVTITTELLDTDGAVMQQLETSTQYVDKGLSNATTWKATTSNLPNDLMPGKYKLRVVLESELSEDTQTIEQDFLWGVLALNATKSIYATGERAQFAISVLDEKGSTICNSQLKLDIYHGGSRVTTLSTDDETILKNNTCEIYGDHITPDYEADYVLNKSGDYLLELTAVTDAGSYVIRDIISAEDEPLFSVKRVGPTRLYPVADYPMTVEIISPIDTVVNVAEYVPASFDITQPVSTEEFHTTQVDERHKLEWRVVLKAGEAKELKYIFDAPDVSPAYYVAGALEIYSQDNQELLFTEGRQWQFAGDAIGHMLLLFDGVTVPTGWSCVSCTSGDAFYQTFIRGDATYGGTGGTTAHTHTVSTSVTDTGSGDTSDGKGGTTIIDSAHTHSFTPTIGSANNLPSYRQLKVIRNDTSGTPATLPAGVIGLFDATPPSGWTTYSAQNGYFIYGENTVGTTGGTNTHNFTVSGTTGAASSGATYSGKASGTAPSTATHTHTVSLTSGTDDHQPPYLEVILAKHDSAAAPAADMITMWDDTPPSDWDSISDASEAFNAKFIKPNTTYGTTGGSTSHTHSDFSGNSSAASASATSKSGSSTVLATHVHNISVTSVSNESNLPPYRNVIFAKKLSGSTYEQSVYRFYANTNTTDVGSPLAAEDTAANLTTDGEKFRLRSSIHVGLNELASSGANFKLQYSVKSGTCDTGFSGETYSDVSAASGDIRYNNNPSPSDGSNLTTNTNDPTHSTDSMNAQTYEESNNFTNSTSSIPAGEDGFWDFALEDYSAPYDTSYCFRMVESDGTPFLTYSVIPEIMTSPAPAKMVILYDGATIPSGWSCISCNSGEDAYQRFLRGESTYGGTGGAASHTPTASTSVATTGTAATGRDDGAGSGFIPNTHDHTLTPTFGIGSNLPSYRQLKVIEYDAGTPTQIPSGGIILFTTATMPSGFTRYSAQDTYFTRGEGTAATTGGSNTHSHTVSGTTSMPTGTVSAPRTGTNTTIATDTHTHTLSGNTDTLNNEPPYVEAVLGQANSTTSLPTNFIAMWDKTPPGGWNCVSCTAGDAFYQRFFKANNTYGTTGGGATHTHADQNILTSAATPTNVIKSGTVGTAAAHTHNISITGYSVDNHLPPYLNVVFASKGTNTAPNSPTNLDQVRVSGGTSISVGGWANETQVKFTADVSDTDNPDDLKICVEVEQTGTAFDDIATSCGGLVSYTGTAVLAQVTVTGLTAGVDYHWQAQVQDAGAATSSWVSFGANAESARDFSIDTTEPTGTVYDGTTTGVDIDLNNGSLDELSANWNIDSSSSGLSGYEYAIGSTPGASDIKAWTANGTTASVTATGLTLNTSKLFYFSVRTTDNAGNQSTISADGTLVAPTLSFSTAPGDVQFGELNAGNSYTSTKATTLTTSTNAYRGYVIRAFATGLLTSGSNTIGFFDGGSYLSPDGWIGGDLGYGYTSSDTTIQGVNLFQPVTCLGGNPSPCYAPFSLSSPGDIIADHTSLISGTPVVNENFIITHRVTSTAAQSAGTYTSEVIYSVIPTY